jgi:hypothetical protein
LLRLCIALGVSPVDVIKDPVGAACSVSLLSFAAVDVPPDRKPRRPEELVAIAAERIRCELDKVDIERMSSLESLAKELGVKPGYLRYRLGDLCAELGRHRRVRGRQCHFDKIDRACSYLLSGPIKRYPSQLYPSHDHLVAATVRETGVGVAVARRAVNKALKSTLKQKAYTVYRMESGLYRPYGKYKVREE